MMAESRNTKDSKAETRERYQDDRYVTLANRHDPTHPKTAATVHAPHQPGAGVVSEVAIERGQNEAGGMGEVEAADALRDKPFPGTPEAVAEQGESAASSAAPESRNVADADTGFKGAKLGALDTEPADTDRDELTSGAGATVVEDGEARPADSDASSGKSSKSAKKG
jgi:hypothetical protein